MKLYATTTSERATKGQGGNEYLLIDILGEEGVRILQIKVLPTDGLPSVSFDDRILTPKEQETEKGKQKKTA